MDNLNKQCLELDVELENLYFFCKKIKHLRLIFTDYQNIIASIKPKAEPQNHSDEYLVLSVEKNFIDLLNSVISIREFIKKKFVKVDNNSKITPTLVEKYSTYQNRYEILLKETFNHPKLNKIKDFSEILRNYFSHHGLFKPSILEMIIPDVLVNFKKTVLNIPYKDFQNRFEKYCNEDERSKSKKKTKLSDFYQYFFDKHIISMQEDNLILSLWDQVKTRMIKLKMNAKLSEIELKIEDARNPIIQLPSNLHYIETKERIKNILRLLYEELLKNKDYRMYGHDFLNHDIHFDLDNLFIDIYDLYISFYTQLCELIYSAHKQDIDLLQELSLQFPDWNSSKSENLIKAYKHSF